jgi:ankyrin repeat protein
MIQACFEGNYKIAELLLEAGAERSNQNRWKKTPLEEAFSTGQVES